MLALPGSAYLYQGEELGLPEVIDLPDDARQDPTWFRTRGERYGRDGCRVPMPWTAEGVGFGFNETGASWLPQPAEWATYARDVQQADPDSTLNLYTRLLELRARYSLGHGELEWLDGYGADVIAFRRGALYVVANLGDDPVDVGGDDVLILAQSGPFAGTAVPTDTAVWFERV